ncbi:MAG: hypothetical protein FWE95_09165 [Planctomycetaceae bacterium]|nr:hypothetical protein [Planctomycetaceae bacterium]
MRDYGGNRQNIAGGGDWCEIFLPIVKIPCRHFTKPLKLPLRLPHHQKILHIEESGNCVCNGHLWTVAD